MLKFRRLCMTLTTGTGYERDSKKFTFCVLLICCCCAQVRVGRRSPERLPHMTPVSQDHTQFQNNGRFEGGF